MTGTKTTLEGGEILNIKNSILQVEQDQVEIKNNGRIALALRRQGE